jgi:hypothetical protein
MPVESCTQSLCDLALQFGEDDEEGGMVSPFTGLNDTLMAVPRCAFALTGTATHAPSWTCLAPRWLQSRPFGVALLVAGWDDDGPVL